MLGVYVDFNLYRVAAFIRKPTCCGVLRRLAALASKAKVKTERSHGAWHFSHVLFLVYSRVVN